ncbi:MAG: hypothetical protein U0487_03745 [Patescibacteria group bacterium]
MSLFAEILQPKPGSVGCLEDPHRWRIVAEMLGLPPEAMHVEKKRYVSRLTKRGNLFILVTKHRVMGVLYASSYGELPAVKVHRCAFGEGLAFDHEQLLVRTFLRHFDGDEVIITNDVFSMDAEIQERLGTAIQQVYRSQKRNPPNRLWQGYRDALHEVEDPLYLKPKAGLIRSIIGSLCGSFHY